MKTSLQDFNSRIEEAKEGISELEDMTFEIIRAYLEYLNS